MKTHYISLVVGVMCLTVSMGQAQNLISDGDFSETTEIIPFDTPTPLNTWAYRVNENSGAEANPSVVDGVAKIQILNPGYDYPDVQLTQVGFPLNQGHVYQLTFDVRADSDRYVRLFLGEEGGNAINLIESIYFYLSTGWQTISLQFEATSVFDLHKLSFEFGGNETTTYLDNVVLQDLGPAPPEKVVISGTFQNAMGCETDWDANCEITALTFNSSTELYSGTFEIPEGNHRYKVAVGGSWDINYGENGDYGGADIFLCVPAGPEEVTFTYDPVTHLVTTSPMTSGFSPDCLPIVVLSGSFQDELGCSSDGMGDCTNTALTWNPESGLFEGDFHIPSGCYNYRVVLDNNLQNNYGQEGIFNGEDYSLYIPSNPEVTHFTYDPISHVVTSSPYVNPPQEVTQVSLVGSLQSELGCYTDDDYYGCDNPALISNLVSGKWEGTFFLPAGCYSYYVKETFGCNSTNFYGEEGTFGGEQYKIYIPSAGEISFSYDPETHLIQTTPYSGVPQEVTNVSLVGSFQDELGCEYEFDFYGCDKPALENNPDTGMWEVSFWLPSGCYSYFIKETFGCTVTFYGENGTKGNIDEIQLYLPEDGEISFTYDPETHLIKSTPFSSPEISKVSLTGTIQEVLCAPEYYCEKSTLVFNADSGMWEGNFMLPKGCYTYMIEETSECSTLAYGENGEIGGYIQLYVPLDGEVSFSYDPETHIISSSPYSGTPQEVTAVALEGSSFQNELLLNTDSGLWEGSFTLSEGCYTYWVKETFGCVETYYGENGVYWQEIQLYVPTEAEITFSYDPQTHLITSTPYSGNPQEATSVTLEGSSFQNELTLNAASGLWEGSFTLSEGCYTYQVREIIGCNENYYGENGEYYGSSIELYVPAEAEITFKYDPQTHLVNSTPYSGYPEEITSVSLEGSLQNELILNADSGLWEGSYSLSEGCYTYQVQEKSACITVSYGENGETGGYIQLYVPLDGEVSFSYDPRTHIISSSPYSGTPQEVTAVALEGSFQNELILNTDSGLWEGSFTLSEGCYTYWVKETFGCVETYYGENGVYGQEIQLYVPTEAELTFSYDPQSHTISSTPYSGVPQEITKVSLLGSLQDELGCESEANPDCDKPALNFNPDSGFWEGSFTLPAGCYWYLIKEKFGCNEGILFGENGQESGDVIHLYVPSNGEITFSYDPQTHLISSTPYGDVPPEMTNVYLIGDMQDELGCAYPSEEDCENSALDYDPASETWKGSFTLPAGCYTYRVREVTVCGAFEYGENGNPWGEIQLYIPEEAEITFSYDPQTHLLSSTPYIGVPEEITSVSLTGTFQEEFGCESINNPECDQPALVYDPDSAKWKGSFTLSAGCHAYWVKETFGCNWTLYGENGSTGGEQIQLYIPEDGEISFTYDPETHIITSTPYSGVPQEATAVSLTGIPDDRALQYNTDSGFWEASFSLPAGCYDYWVKEESMCSVFYYGENGSTGQNLSLYVPEDAQITFSYDPQTHILTSSPYSGVPQEVTGVALRGTLQRELGCNEDWEDECEYSALEFNPESGLWEGSFMLSKGCYIYHVQERFGCEKSYYGEDGVEGGNDIKLYIPADGEITFSYDPQTHLITSTPYSGSPQEITKVWLYGSLQEETGCEKDYDQQCGNPEMEFNPDTGAWEGSFVLPAGCYTYWIVEISGCNVILYGENGVEWANEIQLYVPSEEEIAFSYDPQTHEISSTPYSGAPEVVTKVSLLGNLQNELGCTSDFDLECESPMLEFNPETGAWEGTFALPAGCYNYWVKETVSCNILSFYGDDGVEWGYDIKLFVPADGEITFTYDPETHIITTTPYFDISTANQCPENIFVDNTPGTCGAMVDYPGFVATEYCGGDVMSVTQTAGLPSGSLFPIGATTNTFELVRTTGEVTTCSFEVVVTDTESPVIADLQENYEPLWPPNHKMVPVYIDYVAWDNCSIAGTEITITSNEPESTGKGDEAPDWEVVDEHQVLLRAERSGKGTGREYYITIKVTDDSGNFTERTVTVAVAKDQRKTTEIPVDAVDRSYEYILYPVAASDIVNIKGPKSTSNRPYMIYDISGVMKKQGIINNDRVEINSLPNATYILRFETDDGSIFKRFIKN
ncbi:pullulanase X25 domain-containing protein [Salinimicrobium flavum]|uniref:Carbohydrate binding domain-containing protein n=1 Tax=Salinimicrobium flavum TaxID=1737065 RepID=A0ABW5IXL8_9FLAO